MAVSTGKEWVGERRQLIWSKCDPSWGRAGTGAQEAETAVKASQGWGRGQG